MTPSVRRLQLVLSVQPWGADHPQRSRRWFSTAEQREVGRSQLAKGLFQMAQSIYWQFVFLLTVPHTQSPSSASWLVLKPQEWKPGFNRALVILPKGTFQLQSLCTSPKGLWICSLEPCGPIKKSESWKPKKVNAFRSLKIQKIQFHALSVPVWNGK